MIDKRKMHECTVFYQVLPSNLLPGSAPFDSVRRIGLDRALVSFP